MTGLSILKHIYKILSENTELSKIVDNKIFSNIAEETTSFPFLILLRNNISVEYTKDRKLADVVDVDFVAVSTKYVDSLNIIEIVRNTFENKKFDEYNIKNCVFLNCQENFVDNAYLQQITLQFIVT